MFPVSKKLINAEVTNTRRTPAYNKSSLSAVITVGREDVPATGVMTQNGKCNPGPVKTVCNILNGLEVAKPAQR